MHRLHEDRDEVKQRAEADFLNLYLEHGGIQRWKSLKCLFHEDRTPSASIHKGRYHCFGCGISLDVFEFLQRVRGEDFKSALAFLAARYGVRLKSGNLTESEKRAYARRRGAAEVEARELIGWKADMLATLRQVRDVYFQAFHRCQYFIVLRSLDHPHSLFLADAADCYRDRYECLDERIARIERATYAELVPFFRARRQAA